MRETKVFGIDEPLAKESALELKRDGRLYLSLYHECKVLDVDFQTDFLVRLEKVKDTYGNPDAPSVGTKIDLVFRDAKVAKIHAEEDGNLEDITEFIVIESGEDGIELSITISGFEFAISASSLSLSQS